MKKTFLILIALLCSSCGSKDDSGAVTAPAGGSAGATSAPAGASAASQPAELARPPSWYPLGGEVYQERDRFAAEKELLEFLDQPRWFHGVDREVTTEEVEAWKARQGKAAENPDFVTRPRDLPRLAYPKSTADIPLQDQGATLQLDIAEAETADELLFTLSLSAGDRTVVREIEHRWTNVLPFLFAFTADGKAVNGEFMGAPPQRGEQADRDRYGPLPGQSAEASILTVSAKPDPFLYMKFGGATSLVDLVPANSTKKWTVRVAAKSMDALIPAGTKDLDIVAAFSERQNEIHSVYADRGVMWQQNNILPQILIRSDVVHLRRSGAGWVRAETP